MFKDKYFFIKVLMALVVVAVVVAVLTSNRKMPLSADIVSGNTSADALASDFLDWMTTADGSQVNNLVELSANSLKIRTNSDSLDISSTRNAWEQVVDKVVESKPQVTFKVSTEKVYEKTVYKDYSGKEISHDQYDSIRQKLQNQVEKELDKDKVIERYERTVTPSNELVKRWEKMFDAVMEEARRRMPPFEEKYKQIMYIDYKLKDGSIVRVFVRKIGDTYYVDESLLPDYRGNESNSTGD